ncbi:MAG: hypothetical protein ACK47N_15155 [Microcystis sp.]|uniref:hypothetical protein n=1 Tax=unclassified Microcystis TaxID=2643300 RepID=UPI001193AD7D|nr:MULTISPECIES: hypothetical protein [unclassified Microcystis]NCQ99169.1 hypothetical protein [Microcystis aeruginosa L211-11]NCR31734.1 hypothetical protein [Microcystis aeruginosa L211-101]TRT63639.1 MAG: hypothetical protein EWV67_11275 [Microcystis sp. M_QC_C_20170808_M2Col]TRT67029.1 MAG: hypothetical protein EWV68_13570 [Microcystis sp. M_QC_C_20170808_M9Col]
MLLKLLDSLILCVINLTYIVVIDLCVLCVSVVRSPHYLLPAVFIDYLDQKSQSSLIFRENWPS